MMMTVMMMASRRASTILETLDWMSSPWVSATVKLSPGYCFSSVGRAPRTDWIVGRANPERARWMLMPMARLPFPWKAESLSWMPTWTFATSRR